MTSLGFFQNISRSCWDKMDFQVWTNVENMQHDYVYVCNIKQRNSSLVVLEIESPTVHAEVCFDTTYICNYYCYNSTYRLVSISWEPLSESLCLCLSAQEESFRGQRGHHHSGIFLLGSLHRTEAWESDQRQLFPSSKWMQVLWNWNQSHTSQHGVQYF